MAVCDAQHIGQVPQANTDTGSPAPPGAGQARAHQDVTPAVRRAVLARDHEQCTVPGCTSASFLDVHHLVPRSEGGAHDPDRLVTLCGAHHRALHHGQLRIEGNVATRVTYRHADGTRYGARVDSLDPSSVFAFAEAFRALRSLGFRETEARRALNDIDIRSHVGDTGVVQIIRAALGRLSPGHRH
jgi:hypothetical protein